MYAKSCDFILLWFNFPPFKCPVSWNWRVHVTIALAIYIRYAAYPRLLKQFTRQTSLLGAARLRINRFNRRPSTRCFRIAWFLNSSALLPRSIEITPTSCTHVNGVHVLTAATTSKYDFDSEHFERCIAALSPTRLLKARAIVFRFSADCVSA